MKIENSKKPNSFRAPLLELVIIIGIFAIVSVYLLRMFMASDKLRGNAVATTESVLLTQSVAEYIKGLDKNTPADIYAELAKRFGGNSDQSGLKIKYGKSFEKVESNEKYTLIVTLNDSDRLITGQVGFYSADLEKSYCVLEIAKEKADEAE
ncbi:MAG: hypothetical protein J6U10_02595 [Lachnospiraceae bacterium]|nr:hypothetical protein [Lachnospiraceae bacterium]MBP5183842.1 hypothetical protein [Lachnospiraceae bacterium]